MCDEETCRDLRHRNSLAQAEITRIRGELEQAIRVGVQLAAALSTVEWIYDQELGYSYCDDCGMNRDRDNGHTEHCIVGLALNQAELLGWRQA